MYNIAYGAIAEHQATCPLAHQSSQTIDKEYIADFRSEIQELVENIVRSQLEGRRIQLC